MSSVNGKTAVLLIGFGGPTSPEEVKPFLQSIVDGSNIPEERLRKVEKNYERIGGVSPFNQITYGQKEALERYLKSKGTVLPIGVAFRHSSPSFQDAFESFNKFGVKKVVGFVLASFRSFVSREWYYEKLAQGQALAKAEGIEVVYTGSFDDDPQYLEAQAQRVRELYSSWPAPTDTFFIYTAHSIPMAMCEQSCRENERRCYGFQFHEAARSVSDLLGLRKNWDIAYQSRSGNPRDLWMEPDVKDRIRQIDRTRFKSVTLIPVGFLCDNVEVIHDLDMEAQELCRSLGLEYKRASTVTDHPKFIEMMAAQILEKV